MHSHYVFSGISQHLEGKREGEKAAIPHSLYSLIPTLYPSFPPSFPPQIPFYDYSLHIHPQIP